MYRWPASLGLLAALLVFGLAVCTRTPLHDRDWVDHLAATPEVSWNRDGSIVTLGPVRDWQYLPVKDGVAILEAYRRQTSWQLDQLEAVWFIEEPHPGWRQMAHTFVIFDFGATGMLGLTIEARRTEDETYNPLLGTLNKYELLYVWAEPRDLLTRRATLLGHELFAYRLALTREQRIAYFRALVDRTAALAERPRFYNTLTSNCTNELAKAARLDWDPAFILTGHAAQALFERGLIAGDDFASVRARASIADALLRRPSWDVDALFALLRERGQEDEGQAEQRLGARSQEKPQD